MTRGSGYDTFFLDYYFDTVTVGGDQGATIHGFKPSTDHLIFDGSEGAWLTNDGDTWTVHSPDPDYQNQVGDPSAIFEVSFHILGVTELSPADYSFFDVFA
jgi:hypothetical protein